MDKTQGTGQKTSIIWSCKKQWAELTCARRTEKAIQISFEGAASFKLYQPLYPADKCLST